MKKDAEAAGTETAALVHVADTVKLERRVVHGTAILRAGGALTLAGLTLMTWGGVLPWLLGLLGASLASIGLGLRARAQVLGEPGATCLEYRRDGLLLRVAGDEVEIPWGRLHGAMAHPLAGTLLLYLDGPGPGVPDVLEVSPSALASELTKLRWLLGPGSQHRAVLLPAVEAIPEGPKVHPEDAARLDGVTRETVLWVEGYQPPWLVLRLGEDRVRVDPSWASPIGVRVHAPGDRVPLPGGHQAEVLEAGWDLAGGQARYRLRGEGRAEDAWVPAGDLAEELVVEAGLDPAEG